MVVAPRERLQLSPSRTAAGARARAARACHHVALGVERLIVDLAHDAELPRRLTLTP